MAWAYQLDFIRCYFPKQWGYNSFSVAFKPNSAKKWSTTNLTYGLFLFGLFQHEFLNQLFSSLNGCSPNDSVVYLGCSLNGGSPNVIGSPIGGQSKWFVVQTAVVQTSQVVQLGGSPSGLQSKRRQSKHHRQSNWGQSNCPCSPFRDSPLGYSPLGYSPNRGGPFF